METQSGPGVSRPVGAVSQASSNCSRVRSAPVSRRLSGWRRSGGPSECGTATAPALCYASRVPSAWPERRPPAAPSRPRRAAASCHGRRRTPRGPADGIARRCSSRPPAQRCRRARLELAVLIAQELQALRDLVADEQVLGRPPPTKQGRLGSSGSSSSAAAGSRSSPACCTAAPGARRTCSRSHRACRGRGRDGWAGASRTTLALAINQKLMFQSSVCSMTVCWS